MTDEELGKVFATTIVTLLAILFAICIGSLMIMCSGLIFMLLWNWFVVLIGLPKIAFWTAVGIAMVFEFFNNSGNKDINKDNVWGYVGRLMFKDSIILFFGWLVHFLV